MMPAVRISPIRLPFSRMAIFSATSTLPFTEPKIVTLRALILARILPFWPTVREWPSDRVPSTSPSTCRASSLKIWPVIFMDAPITATSRTGSVRAGGARAWGALARAGTMVRVAHAGSLPEDPLRNCAYSTNRPPGKLVMCPLACIWMTRSEVMKASQLAAARATFAQPRLVIFARMPEEGWGINGRRAVPNVQQHLSPGTRHRDDGFVGAIGGSANRREVHLGGTPGERRWGYPVPHAVRRPARCHRARADR